MKKTLIAAFFVLGLAAFAQADQAKFKVPVGVNGIANGSLESAGVEKCQLITSTTPTLVTDRNGTTITDGLIYWVIVPSTPTATANTVYAEFRDTNTANASSARLLPQVPVNIIMSTTSLFGGNPGNQVINFDPPIPFYNGLSVNLVPAAAAPASGIEFAVGVRWKK